MECLALNNQVVIITEVFLDFVDGFSWESRNDTVNKCSVNAASLFEPCFELFAEVPEFDILIDCFLQLMSVQEYKLAWTLSDLHAVAEKVLAADFVWEENLNNIPGLTDMVADMLKGIEEKGMYEMVKEYVK